MFRVRRKQRNSDHQDQAGMRDGEREDTAVKPESPGTQASSSLAPPAGKASQGTTPSQLTPPNSSMLSALLEPWSPSAGSTAELPTTSALPHRRESPPTSRLTQYQNHGRLNQMETLVTIKSSKSTECEEEQKEESSSASPCPSYHLDPETTVPPVGSDGLSSLSPLEQWRLWKMERIKRGTAGTGGPGGIGGTARTGGPGDIGGTAGTGGPGDIGGTGRTRPADQTSSMRRDLLQGKSTMVDLEEDRWPTGTLWMNVDDVDDVEAVQDPKGPVRGRRTARSESLEDCCKEISNLLKQSIPNPPSAAVTLPGRVGSGGAQSTTAAPPTTSKARRRIRRSTLASRLNQNQNHGRPNKVETAGTNKSSKSTKCEEEQKESSSASTGPGATVPPVGGDELSLLLVRLSLLIVEKFKRESAGTGAVDQTLSDLHQWKDRSSDGPRGRRPDGLNVDDVKGLGEPQGQQVAQLLELLCKGMQRLLDEISVKDEKEEDFCRICHGTDSSQANPLISPCRCKGSLKCIHIACLRMWTAARIGMGVGPYSVQCCELCAGWMTLNTGGLFNFRDFYRVTQRQMLITPARYPVLALIHRPSRMRRLVLRVRRWLTSRR